jgi:hypothetical protein
MINQKTDLLFFKINYSGSICLFFLFFFIIPSFAQTEKEYQFSNEFQFNRVAGKKTALEFNFAQGSTSGTEETDPFYKMSQISSRIWVHYFLNKRWKISGSIAHFYNLDVPEISQKKSSEIRFSFQGIYYFTRKDYTLTNRIRIEDRILGDGDNSIDVVFRFREMVKLVYPISNIKVGAGSLFVIASDEIMFKSKGSTTGNDNFDRNRLRVGLGYTFTDYFEVELSYVNEYLPRNPNDKIYNSISTSIIFYDLISTLKKKNGSIPTHE